MKKANSWNAGADATINLNRMVALLFSYNYDRGYRQVYQNSATPHAQHRDHRPEPHVHRRRQVHDHPGQAVPRCELRPHVLGIALASSCTPAGCLAFPASQLPIFPDTHNTNDRLDVQAKYMFDESATRGWGLGPKCQAYVKARVALGAQLQRRLAAAAGAVRLCDPRRQHQRHHDQFVLDGHRRPELQRGAGTGVLRRDSGKLAVADRPA